MLYFGDVVLCWCPLLDVGWLDSLVNILSSLVCLILWRCVVFRTEGRFISLQGRRFSSGRECISFHSNLICCFAFRL